MANEERPDMRLRWRNRWRRWRQHRRAERLHDLGRVVRTGAAGWTLEASKRLIELRGRELFIDSMPLGKFDRDGREFQRQRVQISGLLEHAEFLIRERIPRTYLRRRLSNWWNGTDVETSWALLHQAELLIIEHSDERGLRVALESAIRHAEQLPERDPARVRLEQFIVWVTEADQRGPSNDYPGWRWRYL